MEKWGFKTFLTYDIFSIKFKLLIIFVVSGWILCVDYNAEKSGQFEEVIEKWSIEHYST